MANANNNFMNNNIVQLNNNINQLNNNINQMYNNIIPPTNINIATNGIDNIILPVFISPYGQQSVRDLTNLLLNSHDSSRMLRYIKVQIDYILFQSMPMNSTYLNSYSNELLNSYNEINNMIFLNGNQMIIQRMMDIINRCDRSQLKHIYNHIASFT